jgi:hypothetical protein
MLERAPPMSPPFMAPMTPPSAPPALPRMSPALPPIAPATPYRPGQRPKHATLEDLESYRKSATDVAALDGINHAAHATKLFKEVSGRKETQQQHHPAQKPANAARSRLLRCLLLN